MSRSWKIVMFILLIAIAPPAAGAVGVPLLDCRLEYLPYTAPGLAGDPTDEKIFFYCRNKGDEAGGDASAGTVTLTVTGPAFAGFTYTSDLATIPMDGFYSNVILMAIDDTAVAGEKFQVDVTLTYKDAAAINMPPAIETAEFVLRPQPAITVIGPHQGNAIFIPGNQVVYCNSTDMELHAYEIASGTETTLTPADGLYDCNSHPDLSPDQNRIAFQRREIATGKASIWVMNPDGTDMRMIAGPDDGHSCFEAPRWVDNDRVVSRGDDDKAYYLVNADGTGLTRITREGFTYGAHFDVALVNGMALGAFQLENFFNRPVIQVYDIDARLPSLTVPSVKEAGMPRFRPGRAQLVYNDDWAGNGDLWISDLGGDKKWLVPHQMVAEYQVSDSATEISLDMGDVLQVQSVRRADNPKGPVYDTVPFKYQQANNVITLATPLSGSTPDLRTGVLVDYTYAENNCHVMPNWSEDGNYLTYQRRFRNVDDAWAMDPAGNKKIRLTFDNECNSSDSQNMPAVSADNQYVLLSNNGNLELATIPFNVATELGVTRGGGGDDGGGCVTASGVVPAWWAAMVLLLPLPAGVCLRRMFSR